MSATVGRRRLPGSTESVATALRYPESGGEARGAVARSPARGAAAVSGRSPTPVMASACPAAPCPGRVRCTASAPVDNAAELMDARRTPPPHRDTAPATGPRSEPAQWAVARPQRQPSADEASEPPPLRTARDVLPPPLAVMPAEIHNAAPAAVRQPVNRAFTLRLARAHAADGPSAKRRTDACDTRRDRPIFTESSCSA